MMHCQCDFSAKEFPSFVEACSLLENPSMSDITTVIEEKTIMARKHLLSHLAHAELLTPKLEESVSFFKEVMGLEESGREDQSVYLRCWGEYYHHSLVLTEGPQP